MPIYKFKCKKCSKEFEAIVKIGTQETKCTECKEKAEKILSVEKIRPVFLGGGWTAPSGHLG
jgi:putative FmdB family regulatory protein